MCQDPTYVAQDVGLWDNHLKESLQYLVGDHGVGRAEFFNWQEMLIPAAIDETIPLDLFHLEHLTFELIPVWHVVGETREVGFGMRSFGLRIQGPEEPKVFWTSDTIFDPDHLMEHYEWADWIIHDCETTMKPDGHIERATKSGVHPHFWDLATLPDEIKAKMYLVHYQDNALGDGGHVSEEWRTAAYASGFEGFVEPASELILMPPEEE